MIKVSGIIIAIFITSMILVGGSMVYTDTIDKYGGNNTEDISGLNQTSALQEKVINMENQLSRKTLTGTPLDAPAMVLTGGWEALKMMAEIPAIISKLLPEFMQRLRIPKFMEVIFLLIATTIIIFAMLRGIFKVDI